MLERCLFCRSGFRPNGQLQYMPVARRLAYDPSRGRLWVICGACGRWSLVPIELRWEVVEELEGLYRQSSLAARSDSIGLFTQGDLRVLRIGNAGPRDEAWWRYGRQFRGRRLVRRPLVIGGIAGATALVAFAGGPVWWGAALSSIPVSFALATEVGRRVKFGSVLWRGHLECPKCGALHDQLPFSQFRRFELVPGGPYGEVALRIPCRKCDRWSLRLEKLEAQHVIQRALARRHFFGAPKKRIQEAFGLIEADGSARDFLLRIATERRRFRDYDAPELAALEMAIGDAAEARVAAMKLDEQKETWAREEELAQIIDGELTPV